MNHARALHDFPRAVNPRVRAAYDCRQAAMNRCAGQRKSRATGSRDHERFTITGQLISVQVFICWHRLGSRSSLPPDMNDQLISVLAPDRDILHFEPRLVIALNPLEAEKQVQTDILLFTICKDQPGFEVRSFMYSFAGAYDLKGILPLVERNARRKAVELLLAYVEKRHSELSATLASLRLSEASEKFLDWYSAALLACPWNLRESFYDLRERIHSKPLIAILDGAFEQTIVCRID